MIESPTESTIEADDERLEAITEMDRLSQEAFGEIETIGKLMLAAMRDDKGRWRLAGCDGQGSGPSASTLARSLQMIVERAQVTMNEINCVAEAVGAHYRKGAT